jgi:hypothetical protein
MNALYGYAVMKDKPTLSTDEPYTFFEGIREKQDLVTAYEKKHGMYFHSDTSGANIDFQIIDTSYFKDVPIHPFIKINPSDSPDKEAVILVMDYAFGHQAFEVMDELLAPLSGKEGPLLFDIRSISIMGKAGILPGQKGDIMLATAHVFEGTPHNYMVQNDLSKADFDENVHVYEGPIVTVLGTSLQNRDVLERFQSTTWQAIGLEMEGGHYQRAISAAIIREHISKNIKVRYAYYASDNPLLSGQTLASGSMGAEGVKPTYMITKVILEKIFNS